MARYAFVVYSNPAEGREDEYNDWYSNRHIHDLLACPGILAARRFKLADAQVQPGKPPFKYLSIYEIETDDMQAFIKELVSRAGTEKMPQSEALGDSSPWFWEVIQDA